MKNRFFVPLLILVLSSISLFAQEECEKTDEMMEVWQEYMTPGTVHEMLASNVGEWKAVMTH